MKINKIESFNKFYFCIEKYVKTKLINKEKIFIQLYENVICTTVVIF